MGFASTRNESARLLALVVAVAALEIFVLPRVMFGLLKTSAQWSSPLQVLALMMPRFATMTVLVAALGPVRRGLWFSGFCGVYAVLLLVRCNQSEVYVDWSSTTAAARATLPDVAGLVGALFGFWLGHRRATLRPNASEKPSVHA